MLPAPAWNRTEIDFPREKTISQVVEEQAARTPDAIALIAGPRQFSYRDLNARANRLANRLQGAGVRTETLVGIGIERSHELVVALLAALKAGAAYVPIDLNQPQPRMIQILQDARPAVLLTTQRSRSKLPAVAPIIICDAEENGLNGSGGANATESAANSEHLAYVLYTSGSTGKPKGVMVEHRSVVNFFTAMDRVIGWVPGVWLALTGVAFDISVLELLWTLSRGFTVVLHGDEGVQTITGEIERYRVTHLQSTPSLMRLMLLDPGIARALGSVRHIVLGGEALPSLLVAQLRGLTSARIFNAYGPTETTIWSTTYLIEKNTPNVPIGRPIANTRTYILDDASNVVSVGETGLLYIAGDGVARGYLNQPRLTAERFVPEPAVPGSRMYNTGDLARFLPDGNLEYLGRTDFQVKIRGFRVETGEIETNLELHPSVQQAIVTAREDQFGDKQLVAYIVREPATPAAVTGLDLRSALREKLPEYMMPSRFVFLERFPLTPNGKIDRKALPAPSVSARDEAAEQVAGERTSDGLQTVIEKAWAEALSIDTVGLHENFFDLGANSLMVAEVHVQLRQRLGRDFPLVDLFQFPSVAALASHLSGEVTAKPTAGADRADRRKAAREARVRP
ncbi:MAG: non-ribosomal peptide synthetase [Candidatus Acidiferrales bacterium]